MRAGKYDIKKLQNERMNEFINASIVLSLKKTNSCHPSYRRFDLQTRQSNFVYFYLLIVKSTTYSGSCRVESKKITDI